MILIQEYCEGGFVYYLVRDGDEYLFIQTSHSMSINEIVTELNNPNSTTLNLEFSSTIPQVNKLYFVNFSDNLMFEKSFKQMSYDDFSLFFMEDSPEDPSLKNQYVVVQKAFGTNFHHLFDIKKTSNMPVHSCHISLYEENDDYIFIVIGNLNYNLDYVVNAYGFHKSFLRTFFNTTDTVEIDFCTEHLEEFLFCAKATDYYYFLIFNNSDELNTALTAYTRIRKITMILK